MTRGTVERERRETAAADSRENNLISNGLGSCGDGVDCVSGMHLTITYCLFRS